jgi:hypothetical protein
VQETRDRDRALPLLQFALARIWEGMADGKQSADTLKKIGGVGGALAGEASRLYDKLPDEDKITSTGNSWPMGRIPSGASRWKA